MAAKRRTSKRRLDANSKPQPSRTFFIDRCLGNTDVPNALRARGLSVEVHADHFAHDTDDPTWITEVGRRKWIIVTKDKNIRKRYVEIVALLKAGVPSFVLTSGETTGQENAAAILKASDQMLKCAKSVSTPFVALISPSGAVAVTWTYAQFAAALDQAK